MLIDMKCPSCGATMQFDDSKEIMSCPFCGGTVANIAQQININQQVNGSGKVIHVQDRSNDPNLYISFNTINPAVGMVSKIVTTGVKSTYINGQTLSFHLTQGEHTVVLKIGKRNYTRTIVIPPDNSPVRIYASFNKHAQISIDQPNVPVSHVDTPVSNQTQQVQANTDTAAFNTPQVPKKPKTPLSITAFILSLTGILSLIGAILGALETFVKDKEKEKNHIFSYLAMGIGLFMTIILIIGLIGGDNTSSDFKAVDSKTANNDSVWASEPTAIESFKYYIDGEYVYLESYIGTDKKVWIGSEYVIEGKTYKLGTKLQGLFALRKVTSVIIPEGVTEVKDNIFNSCGVEYIYLPKSLKASDSFYPFYKYFHNVKKVYFGGSESDWKELTKGEDRSKIDAIEIIYDAKADDLTRH